MTYKELKNQTGVRGPHPILLCQECGGEYSANAGDYFWANGGATIECCGEPMALVHKSTVYREA